jgi:large subunit ribosomal protein L2
MAIQQLKPTTAARRGMTSQDFSAITTGKPVRSLLVSKPRGSGRNHRGVITTRHQGGGTRKFYRQVNFKLPEGTRGTIEHIEYDPNRSARLARVRDETGLYHYILAGAAMRQGQTVRSGASATIEDGNRLPLENIPVGSTIHAIELKPGKGAQLVRSAGGSAQLAAKEGGYAQVRLPSGEIRLIKAACMASLSAIGNAQHQNVKLGKAGRSRYKGVRPTVRGVVMNAADHPHGGGDGGRHGVGGGKNIGHAPKTPWGQKTLGYKTRKRKSTSNMIVRSRHASKRK